MDSYVHKVQYYETDKMGITHHSNYIRWMEEARIEFFNNIGFNYARLEDEDIVSPVVSVSCKYKSPTTFDDSISITVSVKEFKGIRLILGYVMKKAENVLVCEAESSHCFIGADGKPINIKKVKPEFFERLTELIDSNN